jgi:hypothetical protein
MLACHGVGDKVKSAVEKQLFLKNQNHTLRTISHLCEVTEHTTNCRNKQHESDNNLHEWLKTGTSNVT